MSRIHTETGCNYRKVEWLLCLLEGNLVGDAVVGDYAECVFRGLEADGRECPDHSAGLLGRCQTGDHAAVLIEGQVFGVAVDLDAEFLAGREVFQAA